MMCSSIKIDPSITDVISLLHVALSELASVKHSLATLQTSYDTLKATTAHNHHQMMQEIKKLCNSTKKHYTQLTSLPKDVVCEIMSWIHPQEVWKLRGLSKSFRDLLSSTRFAALNIARFVPQPVDCFQDTSTDADQYDIIFFGAPASYQTEYARMILTKYSRLWWLQPFDKPIPIPWLLELRDLVELDWMCCSLIGPIPDEIGRMTSLKLLDLSTNSLEGEIPLAIGNLANLTILELYDNDGLCGTLPAELGNLVLLEKLVIYGTSVMGPIPLEIGNLRNLITLVLDLGINPTCPSVLIEELSNLSRLTTLDLSRCHLVGGIPSSLGRIRSLQHLLLYQNELEGPVPMEWSTLELETCKLNGNKCLTYSFIPPEGWSV
ncbi:L domain-like protein [Rhizoclosmatium globosum]|uniref:L domain-like protein n=1 Tax=Rhizoclosmatium globosum TaxID=329046 RepID=A0A1Y2CNA4_9FUNG|nr:L domain-like protein [Rhizoclosmatium globosum]|eukprot:ORY47825.1 L domain-like protein [Rhizoclosmatium globosum]